MHGRAGGADALNRAGWEHCCCCRCCNGWARRVQPRMHAREGAPKLHIAGVAHKRASAVHVCGVRALCACARLAQAVLELKSGPAALAAVLGIERQRLEGREDARSTAEASPNHAGPCGAARERARAEDTSRRARRAAAVSMRPYTPLLA